MESADGGKGGWWWGGGGMRGAWCGEGIDEDCVSFGWVWEGGIELPGR